MEGGMDGAVEMQSRRALLRSAVPSPLRAHPFLTVLVLFAIVGGGVRYVPTGTAAVPGSSAAGAGSTACAVK
jgi:hypothetical protein